MSPIPLEHAQVVCLPGCGAATCAFLAPEHTKDYLCAKGSMFDSYIRRRVADGSFSARGDNCSGPPDFKPNEN